MAKRTPSHYVNEKRHKTTKRDSSIMAERDNGVSADYNRPTSTAKASTEGISIRVTPHHVAVMRRTERSRTANRRRDCQGLQPTWLPWA
ncbi:hypothetical protein R1flu_028919 [Riccia fluitans]|uniref:Uncharacterized protein n=1 Tax=Riccia fluitans TaxID=41844 RepID=A0ABD1XR20_9MARC